MSVIDRVKTHFETLQTITIEVDESKIDRRINEGYLDKKSNTFNDALILAPLPSPNI